MKQIMTASALLFILSIPVGSTAQNSTDQVSSGVVGSSGLNGYAQNGGIFLGLSAVTSAGSTTSISASGLSGSLSNNSSSITGLNNSNSSSNSSFIGASGELSLQTTGATNVQLISNVTGTASTSTVVTGNTVSNQ